MGQVVIAEEALRKPTFGAYRMSRVEGCVVALSELHTALNHQNQADAWIGKSMDGSTNTLVERGGSATPIEIMLPANPIDA